MEVAEKSEYFLTKIFHCLVMYNLQATVPLRYRHGVSHEELKEPYVNDGRLQTFSNAQEKSFQLSV